MRKIDADKLKERFMQILDEEKGQLFVDEKIVSNIIDAQPTVDDWIPCKNGKNLPSRNDNEKWDWTSSSGDDNGCMVLVTIKGGFVEGTIFWEKFNDFNEDDVIAWQPFPEAYNPTMEE